MRPFYFLFYAAVSFPISANVTEQLNACRQLSDDSVRLQCYEAINQQLESTPATSTTLAEPGVLVTPTPPPIDSTTATIPVFSEQEQQAMFGKKMSDTVTIEKITSSIVGEFKGWKKGDILHLANGQKWKVTSSSKGYTKLQNPKVEISQGFWSSFNIRVEGFRSIAKVRRID